MPRDSRPPMDVPTGPILDEVELVARCRRGERAAFEQLYRAHRRQVAANLYRVLGDRGELDDLVQEVFVIAFRGMGRFRGDAKLSTWLYRIAVNVALGRLRAKSRKPPPVPAEPGSEETVDGTPETLLAQREDVARVYRVLERLAPKKRVVLVLHEIQGLDIKEIADIVGAPLVTVRTRLHYARKEFYRLIAGQEP
ncbi:MAG TPA: sigma-70 family RNA polymerase sigma factor [Haliangiales bacterium]|nr:sigma-70 family RNA polymerase sigma factor [Haliangiales bacterium]